MGERFCGMNGSSSSLFFSVVVVAVVVNKPQRSSSFVFPRRPVHMPPLPGRAELPLASEPRLVRSAQKDAFFVYSQLTPHVLDVLEALFG